ncbi:MAG: hypothetical protein CLLPBCKN_004706 [Chroococcidiopsis cubana SAG 39.79]|nr:hypothetical protein [Chroococcidiopsis cubana SAG 39.79]
MQKIDTMSSPALDPAKSEWNFVEVWYRSDVTGV